MRKKQLIIPHYCKNCQHLTFLLREADPFQFSLLDYLKGTWKTHSCAQIHPNLIGEISQQTTYAELEESPKNLPFQYQPSTQSKKRHKLTIGIVLNVTEKDESHFITVITPENQILTIKILDNTNIIRAGSSIKLKGAARIGKDTYRLEKTEFTNPGRKTTHTKPTLEVYYQLILKAKDQEKLETFINRLIIVCNKNRSLPINIIPVMIKQEDNEQVFQRQMNIPLESDLLQKIEKVTVPESVQVAVRHL